MIALTKDGFVEVTWRDVAKNDYLGLWNNLEDAHQKLYERQIEKERIENQYPLYSINGSVLTVSGVEFVCDVYSGTSLEMFEFASKLGIRRSKILNQRKSNSVTIFIHENKLIGIKYCSSFYFYDTKWNRLV